MCLIVQWNKLEREVGTVLPGFFPTSPAAGGRWVLPSPGRAARCSRSPSVAAWGWPRSHRCNLEQKRQNNVLEANYNHGQ